MERKIKDELPVKRYFVKAGIATLSGMILILFYFICYRYKGFSAGWDEIVKIFSPFIIGFVIAYLINPIVRGIESSLYPRMRARCLKRYLVSKAKAAGEAPLEGEALRLALIEELEHPTYDIPVRQKRGMHKRARYLGIASGFVVLGVIIYLLILIIIPQMVESIKELIKGMPTYMDKVFAWLEDITNGQSREYLDVKNIESIYNDMSGNVEHWVTTSLLPGLTDTMSTIFKGAYSVVKVVFNIIIGIVAAIYLLTGKETFAGQAKKITYAAFKPKTANYIVALTRKINDTFQNYIVGSLIDSFIVGVAVYIACVICSIPYSPLIAVIVGVTNLVPVFGPFIGAIPSIFFVLVAEPIKAIPLAIIILVIQQIDGNVIKPIVLGDTVGLSSFWILFAIVVGGALFGVVGIIIGVPVFAIVYFMLDELVTYILIKKRLPLDTYTYISLNKVNPATGQVDMGEIEIPRRPGEKIRAKHASREEYKKRSMLDIFRGSRKPSVYELDRERNQKRVNKSQGENSGKD